jgi:MFS family permease
MSASATPLIMKSFGSTNETLGAFVTSVFILGYAFGPLAWAPLSELYGRAHIYNICNVLFLVFSIACAVANNMGTLIAFRFFAGIAASSELQHNTQYANKFAYIFAFRCNHAFKWNSGRPLPRRKEGKSNGEYDFGTAFWTSGRTCR